MEDQEDVVTYLLREKQGAVFFIFFFTWFLDHLETFEFFAFICLPDIMLGFVTTLFLLFFPFIPAKLLNRCVFLVFVSA